MGSSIVDWSDVTAVCARLASAYPDLLCIECGKRMGSRHGEAWIGDGGRGDAMRAIHWSCEWPYKRRLAAHALADSGVHARMIALMHGSRAA